jgi:predicted nucleotidyltransferase
MTEEHILQELNITDDVLAIFPYGSHVYGTANAESDTDFIIVMKSSMLKDGSFRSSSPKTNSDRTIQGVIYSRGGFINAVNDYDIAALECLSLADDKVIKNKWKFKVNNWNEKEMVKKVITKASASRHVADQQAKSGNKDRAKKGMLHALRILHFGLQLKEHGKIVNFGACNDLYREFDKIVLDDFDTRDYYKKFDELLVSLRA